MASAATNVTRVITIPPELLEADLTINSRWREIPKEKIMERAQSMLANGQEQPIVVRPIDSKRYKVVIGYTRYLAGLMINKLGLMPSGEKFRLDAVVRDMSDEEAFANSIIENYDHNAITIIDTAHNVRTLSERFKWSDTRICEHYRIKKEDRPKWMADLRRLIRLPKKRQEEIEDGILNPAIGLVLAEIPEERHEEVLRDAEDIRAARKQDEPEEETADQEPEEADESGAEAPEVVAGAIDPAQEAQAGATVSAPAAKPVKAKKKAKKKAVAAKSKSVTKRDVVQAARNKGLLAGKKVSRSIAQLREFWKPVSEEKKASKAGRLATAELAFYAGGDADVYWKEILAVLK